MMQKVFHILAIYRVVVLAALMAVVAAPLQAGVAPESRVAGGERVFVDTLPTFRVYTDGQLAEWLEASPAGGVAASGCPGPVTATHTDADFTGGEFIIQAGFAESETAAVSFSVDPVDFPLRIETIEAIFAQRHTVVETVTEWSVTIWDGYPDNGFVVGRYESDDVILPHLRLDPGTQGANVQVVVSEEDALFVLNESGTGVFSVGFTIEAHNQPSSMPCLIPPSEMANAFPTVDTSGLASRTDNWLWAINCGAIGCPAFWHPFGDLGVCEPSGDWVIRATYTCDPPVGACCNPEGLCFDLTPEEDCDFIEGTWFEGIPCLLDPCSGTCPEATIISSNPASGVVDARQPHACDDDTLSARHGIGGADEPIMINIGLPDADADCFALCESQPDPVLGANAISEVIESFLPGVYEIRLARPITPGAVTRVYYRDGSYVSLIAHPANVNADDTSARADVFSLLEHMNDIAPAPYDPYSVDINHSGGVDPGDLLALIDLLNGAGLHTEWSATTKPTPGDCP